MKKIIKQRFIIILMILVSSKNIAQQITPIEKEKGSKETYVIAVEIAADFPGGKYKLIDFVSHNFKIPAKAVRNKVKGKIPLQFTIEKNGFLSDIKTLSNLGYGLEEETERVFKMSPQWIPAKVNGKPIKSKKIFIIYIDTSNKKKERLYFDKE
ncbi:MAG: hypothetical protein EOO44_08540 [Flavobacterium sp.]|nr:MAG: hypothetical protein EOO44_08540 [Flavobacterium sp.]